MGALPALVPAQQFGCQAFLNIFEIATDASVLLVLFIASFLIATDASVLLLLFIASFLIS